MKRIESPTAGQVLGSATLHDPDAESAVLGHLVVNQDAHRLVEYLEADDFFDDENRRLFVTICDGIYNGLPVDCNDAMAVPVYLRSIGQWDDLRGAFIKAAAQPATVGTLPYHAKTLRDYRIKRETQFGILDALQLPDDDAKYAAIEKVYQRRDLLKVDRQEWRFQPKTLDQMAATSERHEFLVDNLIVANQPLVLGGPPKSSKTGILIDLCLSLATATRFLGIWKVNKPRRVLVFSGESGRQTLLETGERQCKAKGLSRSDAADLLIESDNLPDISTPAGVRELTTFVQHIGADVVAIDPTYLAFSISADASRNVFEMGSRLRTLNMAVAKAGATLIVAHHLKKSTDKNKNSAPELEDLTGSGFAEFARQWLLVRPREAYDMENGIQRLSMNIGGSAGYGASCALDIIEGTRASAGGLIWDVRRLTPEAMEEEKTDQKAARQKTNQEQRRRRLLDALDAIGETGDTLSKICELAGLNYGTVRGEIDHLEDIMQPCTVTKSGKEYDGYKRRTDPLVLMADDACEWKEFA